MEISNFAYKAAAERGYSFNLKHPDDKKKELDIKFAVVGSDSSQFRQARMDVLREVGKRVEKKEDPLTVDEINARIFSRCILAWENIEENGNPIEFSVETAERLFNEYPWMCDQVAEVVEKRDFFFQTKAKKG